MISVNESSSKEKLIFATIKLMSSRGFESMGIHSILEAADVSKSNFYYHFKSKEDLCLAALDMMSEYFFSMFLDPIFSDTTLTPKGRFQKLFEVVKQKMTDSSCSVGCPFVNLSAETADFYPSFQERLSSYYREYSGRLALCYEEGVKSGEFTNKVPPAQAAEMILALLNGTMLMSKVKKDLTVMDMNVKALFSLISN